MPQECLQSLAPAGSHTFCMLHVAVVEINTNRDMALNVEPEFMKTLKSVTCFHVSSSICSSVCLKQSGNKLVLLSPKVLSLDLKLACILN